MLSLAHLLNCLHCLECCSSHAGAGVRTFLLIVPALFTPYGKMLPHRPLLQFKSCQAHVFAYFFSHLVKCMNSAFLFDYLSVCWRGKGGHMKQLCCLCPRGMSTWSPVRQMWACSAHSLRSTQCHTQVLPCCRSQLPPAMELPMKNPGLEPLIKPKI